MMSRFESWMNYMEDYAKLEERTKRIENFIWDLNQDVESTDYIEEAAKEEDDSIDLFGSDSEASGQPRRGNESSFVSLFNTVIWA